MISRQILQDRCSSTELNIQLWPITTKYRFSGDHVFSPSVCKHFFRTCLHQLDPHPKMHQALTPKYYKDHFNAYKSEICKGVFSVQIG